MQNLLLFLPLICLNANPQSRGANAKKDDSLKFHLSFWAKGARTSHICLLSASTNVGSTDAASPCLQNSFILYLYFWVNPLKKHHSWKPHVLQNDWTQDSPSSCSFFSILNFSSKRFRFFTSILPFSLLFLLHRPQSNNQSLLHIRPCYNARVFWWQSRRVRIHPFLKVWSLFYFAWKCWLSEF